MAHPIGLIVNPASGKDVRRLVAHASVVGNAEKLGIARRAVIGASAAGVTTVLYLPDAHGLAERAIADVNGTVRCEAVPTPGTGAALDTIRAAERMREAGCGAVITLGGDGTNRAVALGWRDAPLIPISTGTNNVFPRMIEGTIAGLAAGLIATGVVPLHDAARQVKRIALAIEDERDDLALIDAALVSGAFAGARALWDIDAMRAAVLARADPAAVGLAAIGGVACHVAEGNDDGLSLTFGPGMTLRAAVAPGLIVPVGLSDVRRVALDEAVWWQGPGVVALDGERERVLRPGQQAALRVRRDGPFVIDVEHVMASAARLGVFRDAPARAGA